MDTRTNLSPILKDTTIDGMQDDTRIRAESQHGSEGELRTGAEDTLESEPVVVQPVLCAVCHEKESRYKCPRCYLPYCSVPCIKIHKATHTEEEARPIFTPETSMPTISNNDVPRPGTVAAANHQGPFSALDSSEDLQVLFRTYPRLSAQLHMIDNATQPPTQNGGYQNNQGNGKKEPRWNSDIGLQKGVNALYRAKAADGKDGEGVREYYKLVLRILSGSTEVDAREMIQNEYAEENAQIISELLHSEMG